MTGQGTASRGDVSPRRRVWASGLSFAGELLRNPLTRNGYALIASSAATSILGVVFWIVAARLFDAEQVGIGSVLIATMITLSSASQLGFGNLLNRQLPLAGANSGNLILTAYCAGVAASLVLAGAFLLAAPAIAPDLVFVIDDPWLSAWFMLAVAAWTVFALQDSALAGLRLSVWVPVENTIYALVKLGLLVALALLAFPGMALFTAWTLPLLFMIAAVNLAIFVRVLPTRRAMENAEMSLRRMIGLIGWDYAAGLTLTAALGVAPLLVLNAAGPVASASYYLSWTITYSLYLIGRSMGISLLAEGVSSRSRLRTLTADTFVHTMLPLGGAALFAAIAAPLIMGLFGPNYAERGAAVLATLSLASVPWGMVTIYLALARVQGWMRTIFIVQLATLVLVVSFGLVLVPILDAVGMALGWLLAHLIVLCGLLVHHSRHSGLDGAIGFALEIASALARIVEKLPGRSRAADVDAISPQRLAQRLVDLGRPDIASWQTLESVASYSDSGIILIGDGTGNVSIPKAVLKFSSSPEGKLALRCGIEGLSAVMADPRLSGRTFEIPSLLGAWEEPDLSLLIEAVIPGRDGRRALLGSNPSSALISAAGSIRWVHSQTAARRTLDAAWTAIWIDEPLTVLGRARPVVLSPKMRSRALEHFALWQKQFWSSRQAELGCCHGDFTPGNLLFVPSIDGLGEHLSGIIDWDATRPDGPAGFDLCQLAVTMRMLDGGGQMGAVVRDLLETPRWTDRELVWLASAAQHSVWSDAEWTRAMVGLVWLKHVAANLEKSSQYRSNRLWLASNLDWVLRGFTGGNQWSG